MSAGAPRNVLILGLDSLHARDLQQIHDPERYRFHALLETHEVIERERYDLEQLLERARQVLQAFDGPVDAIIGHWDFPVSVMVPILCRERGLIAPSLESVLRCEHKYWSRVEQERYVPEHTPDFCAIDPFAERPFDQLSVKLPVWLKPVIGYASTLGFRIDSRADFDSAIEIARRKIHKIGDPVNQALARVELPPGVRGVDGNHMIAEQLIAGTELAPEGYVQRGALHVHGVIDMVRGPNRKSFHAYRYPSLQPRRVQERTVKAVRRLMGGIGFDDGCFNIELFWNERTDALRIVEVNARISQSHSRLMEMVDGLSNHEVAVSVALGEAPHFEHGGGPHAIAAKILHRRYDPRDAVCVRAPTDADLARLRERQPDTVVVVHVREGRRLSELKDQEPYSWLLAELTIGAAHAHELNARYKEAVALLPFELVPVPGCEAASHSVRFHE